MLCCSCSGAAPEAPQEGLVENTVLWVASKRALEASRLLPLLPDPVTSAMVPASVLASPQVSPGAQQ